MSLLKGIFGKKKNINYMNRVAMIPTLTDKELVEWHAILNTYIFINEDCKEELDLLNEVNAEILERKLNLN